MAPISKRATLSASKSKPRTVTSNPGPATTPSIFPLTHQKNPKPIPSKSHKKQQQKRHQLLTRLNKSPITSSGISKPKRPLKRRRTGKPSAQDNSRSEKLLSTVSALADALPASSEWEDDIAPAEEGQDKDEDIETAGTAGEEAAAVDIKGGKITEVGGVKVRVRKPGKSMKNRPGSMKRRAKVERAEKERFRMNLAVLAGLGGTHERGKMEGVEDGRGVADDGVQGRIDKEQDLSDRWQTLRNYIKLTT